MLVQIPDVATLVHLIRRLILTLVGNSKMAPCTLSDAMVNNSKYVLSRPIDGSYYNFDRLIALHCLGRPGGSN